MRQSQRPRKPSDRVVTTSFRTSAGFDLDDVFDLYIQGTKPGPTGYRTGDGTDINQRYAPLAYGSQAADTGFRISNGSDVKTLFAKKGTASYALGFNGGNYSVSSVRSARVELEINANGNWYIYAYSQSVQSTLATGTWLPSGAAAGQYQVQFEVTNASNGSAQNEASSYADASTTRSVSYGGVMVNNGPSTAAATLICRLKRISTGAVQTSSCHITAESTGI